MTSLLTTLIVGVIVIVLGVVNMTGNISSLHSYHRHKVSEENRKPFGRMVGIGTVLVGIGIILEGIMMFLAEKLQNGTLVTVGTVLFPVFLLPGIIIMVVAMKKYNGGIF